MNAIDSTTKQDNRRQPPRDLAPSRKVGQLVTRFLSGAGSRRRRPSKRNLDIHEQVRVEGLQVYDAAWMFKLSQRRIRAICHQVDRWYDEREQAAGGGPPGAASGRSERRVGRRRLEHVYAWAMVGLKESNKTLNHLTTHMAGGSTTGRQAVNEERHYDVQWLKVAKGAAEKLLALSEADESADELSPPPVARSDAMARVGQCLARAIRRELARGGREAVTELVGQIVQACAPEAVEQATNPSVVEEEILPPENVADETRLNYSAVPTGNSPVARPLTASVPAANAALASASAEAPRRKSSPPPAESPAEKNPRGIVRAEQSSPTNAVDQRGNESPQMNSTAARDAERGEPNCSHHAPRDEPNCSHHAPRDEPNCSHHAPRDEPGLASERPLHFRARHAERDGNDEEQHLLAEFERAFGFPLTTAQLDQAASEILALGSANAAMQGYDKRQRAVLREWQRLRSSHHAPRDEPHL